jgi:predicted Zn-dependent peptidase
MSAPAARPRLHTLPNGLRVLSDPDPAALTVAMGYFVATGARDERPEEMGVSHFLEHLMFKGSERMGGTELNERLDMLGGHANAYTSDEATVYHAASLPEDWDELLLTLSELMQPALRPADLELERGVILEEIAMYQDQPATRVFDALRQASHQGHPLHNLVLGTAQTVAALSGEALRRNFTGRYGTRSVVLVASGQFDETAVLARAAELTTGWPQTGFVRQLADHPLRSGLLQLPGEGLGRAHFGLSAPGPGAHDPLRDAGAVLAELIGGDNGRLYWALLDTGLADGADLALSEFEDGGSFDGGFSCDPVRAQEVLDAYRAVLFEVQQHGVSPAELRRASRKLAVGTLMRAETPQGRLFALGSEYLATGTCPAAEEVAARLGAVTAEQITALLARRPFDHLMIAALGEIGTLH